MPRFLERDEAEQRTTLRTLSLGWSAQCPAVLAITDECRRGSLLECRLTRILGSETKEIRVCISKRFNSQIRRVLRVNHEIRISDKLRNCLCFTFQFFVTVSLTRVSTSLACRIIETRELFVEISQANNGVDQTRSA